MHKHSRFLTLYGFFQALSLLLLVGLSSPAFALPDGFVYLKEVAPEVQQELRYYGTNNFVGAQVDGYQAEKVVITRPAAEALARVQERLKPFGLGLKVFDAYRPQRAVDHFVRWAKDLQDTKMKSVFYPDVPKSQLFKRGYIASRSSHSRGSAVDLTLVSLQDGQELDMGTPFDYFSPLSWPKNQDIPAPQRAHRLLLRLLMVEEGFAPYDKEWWHFSLADEPFPETRFDFPVQ